MEKAENIKNGQLVKEYINVIFIDLRNSTNLNKTSNNMINIYKKFLNESYNILQKHGYKNIDIQGDGLYGVIENEKEEQIYKAINDLEELVDKMFKNHNANLTLSSFSGKETFSTFGLNENKNKQLAFFGGIVSSSNKSISLSFPSTKIILNEEAKEIINKYDQNFINQFKNIWLRGGWRIGKCWVKTR